MATDDEAEEPPTELPTELIEIYRCGSRMEADRALVEVLEPEGVEAFLRDRTTHSLPAPSSETGAFFIAVPVNDAARARHLLHEALDGAVLDGEMGEVIESGG